MFKVGDAVKIRKDSEHYGSDNPKNTKGIVESLENQGILQYFIRVAWSNNTTNCYRIEDLEYFEESVLKLGSTVGIKHDQQKPPMDLLPYESLEEIAKVLGFGAKKYERANWAKGINQSRLIAAAMRHIGQFNNGEDFDKESETLHLANAACNLLFAIWMYKNRPDMDDRWVKNIKGKDENE